MKLKHVLLILLSVGLAAPGRDSWGSLQQETPVSVGAAAPDFSLTDSRSQEHKLSAYRGRIVVLEWLNYDCAFVEKLYRSRSVQRLQTKYAAEGVVWLSVISEPPGAPGYYTPEEVNRKSRGLGAHPTAILLDTKGKAGRLYGAKRTPYVFVIDRKGTLVYAGAMDGRRTTGAAGPKGVGDSVFEAIGAALRGKPVASLSGEPRGCPIHY